MDLKEAKGKLRQKSPEMFELLKKIKASLDTDETLHDSSLRQYFKFTIIEIDQLIKEITGVMKMYEFNDKYDKKRGRFAVKFDFNSFEQTFLKAFRNLKKENIKVFPDNGGIEYTVEVTYPDGSKKAFRSFMVGKKLTTPTGLIYQFDEIN